VASFTRRHPPLTRALSCAGCHRATRRLSEARPWHPVCASVFRGHRGSSTRVISAATMAGARGRALLTPAHVLFAGAVRGARTRFTVPPVLECSARRPWPPAAPPASLLLLTSSCRPRTRGLRPCYVPRGAFSILFTLRVCLCYRLYSNLRVNTVWATRRRRLFSSARASGLPLGEAVRTRRPGLCTCTNSPHAKGITAVLTLHHLPTRPTATFSCAPSPTMWALRCPASPPPPARCTGVSAAPRRRRPPPGVREDPRGHDRLPRAVHEEPHRRRQEGP
jgi:hypothetical protein